MTLVPICREINAVREYLLEGGMSSKEAVATLGAKIRERQTDLQSLIVASCEEGLTPEQVESLDRQISGSEREISDLARRVKALTGREQRLERQEERAHVVEDSAAEAPGRPQSRKTVTDIRHELKEQARKLMQEQTANTEDNGPRNRATPHR